MIPGFSFAQYTFDTGISEGDPCCIFIEAGSWEEDNWSVVVDGTTTYTSDDIVPGISGILHCVSGNGIHVIQFFVEDDLYWTNTEEITDCEGDCNECDVKTIRLFYWNYPDKCKTFFDVDFLNQNGSGPYSDECSNPTYTWDFGDGNTDGPNTLPFTFYSYDENGTYTVCMTFSITSPLGELCEQSACFEVVIENCEPDPACCETVLDHVDYSPFPLPWDPCLVGLEAHITPTDDLSNCGNLEYAWDIDGDGNPDGYGIFLVTTFSGPGPHNVCLTLTDLNCGESQTECVIVFLPGCTKSSSESGKIPTKEWIGNDFSMNTMTIFPNPAKDVLTINLNQRDVNTIGEVYIMDASGKTIYTQYTNDQNRIEIDLSEIPSGIHFVRVVDQNGMTQTEKFIKSN